jgi:hypothetical protein
MNLFALEAVCFSWTAAIPLQLCAASQGRLIETPTTAGVVHTAGLMSY